MSYIDDHLLTGEQVRHRTSLHWATLIGPSVLLGLGVLALLGGAASAAGLVILLGLVWLGARWLARSSSEFGVTNKRVLIKVGVMRRRSVETLLTKIEGIGVDQGLVGRMLGYGSIVVTGTGGSKERFDQITDPMDFRRQVQEQIEQREVARV